MASYNSPCLLIFIDGSHMKDFMICFQKMGKNRFFMAVGSVFMIHVKARGGSRGQKYPILIFQYVIELEKTNQMQKTGG